MSTCERKQYRYTTKQQKQPRKKACGNNTATITEMIEEGRNNTATITEMIEETKHEEYTSLTTKTKKG
jgi:prephenate dehydrogenase